MSTHRRRKVWQHDTENLSEDQIRECFHHLGWEVDRFGRDYGEDLFVRIFEDGKPTGNDFYVQLKGTQDTNQYALKSGNFSYSVDAISLRQWGQNYFPVIFILWDIEQRIGYWIHIQPYIKARLKREPNWLDNEDGKRSIHIARDHVLVQQEAQSLLMVINEEYTKVSLGRQYIEQEQRRELSSLDRRLAKSLLAEEALADQQLPSNTISPSIRRQLSIAYNEAVLNSNPDEIEGWVKLASLYYSQHDLQKAVVAINKAHALKAEGVEYALVRGSILTEYAIAQGGHQKSLLHEAIALFESAGKQMRYPEKITTDYNIGNALSALGQYADAIRHFDIALAAEPHSRLAAQIWKNRGTAFYHLGNHEEEFASYQQALHINPRLWEAYASWAITEMHLGNYAHARDLFLSAVQVSPEMEQRHYQQIYRLAFTHWKLGEYEEAYQRVNQVLAVKPDHRNSRLLKLRLLSYLWRNNPRYTPDALAFFKMWLLDYPQDMFVRRELYLLYNAHDDRENASLLLGEAALSADASPSFLYYYARILTDEGRIVEAIDALEKAFKQSKEHNIVHELARLKEKNGDYREAITFYELLLPDDELGALQHIADCHHWLGEHEACVLYCARGILLDPLNEICWNNLVCALMHLKKVICAIFVEQFRQNGVAAVPDDADVQSASERLKPLLEALSIEFGEEFVTSILVPSLY